MALDRRLQDERRLAEMKPARVVEFADAGGQHPHAPIGPDGALRLIVEMDEIVMQQVARLADRVAAGEKFRAADRKHHLLEQAVDAEAGIIAGAEADGDIDIVAVEIENRLRHIDPDIRAWHRCQKAIEARHQPFGGNRWRSGDIEPVLLLQLADALQGAVQAIERIGHRDAQDLALARQPHAAAGAQEQRDADLVLKLLDLMADGRRRDRQFLGGLGETQVPGSGVEGLEGA